MKKTSWLFFSSAVLILFCHQSGGAKKSWDELLSDHIKDTYTVEKGDTFALISKKIFGKAKFWKNIWRLNNHLVKSPSHLAPGMVLTFSGNNGGGPNEEPVEEVHHSRHGRHHQHHRQHHHLHSHSSGRSEEWKELPLQSWENSADKIPDYVDSLGFDKRSRQFKAPQIGFEVQAMPSMTRIRSLGVLFGSRSESKYLGMGDIVYIQASEPLKIGDSYAVSQPPWILESAHPPRRAYSYLTLGKVKIVGVRHHIYIGRMVSARYFIPRGSFLMPLPPKVVDLKAIASPHPVKGTVVIDHNFSTYTSAQHKEVFIDRGTIDGVAPGMVFRSYKHSDPATKKIFSKYDFIIDADILVTQVTENFCSGFVLQSVSPIQEGADVTLITDLATLKEREFEEKEDKQDLPEDLEKIDSDQDEELGPDDARVVKQLENWKSNPTSAEGALIPDAASDSEAMTDLPPPPPDAPPGDRTPQDALAPPPDAGDDLAAPPAPDTLASSAAPALDADASATAPPPAPDELAPPPPDDLAPLPSIQADGATPRPADGSQAQASVAKAFDGNPPAPDLPPPPSGDAEPPAAQNSLAPPPAPDDLDTPPPADLPAPPS